MVKIIEQKVYAELNVETLDNIVRHELKGVYRRSREELDELAKKGTYDSLSQSDKEELDYYHNLLDSLSTVLNHYMSEQDYKEFKAG
jgi:hypothetical protein